MPTMNGAGHVIEELHMADDVTMKGRFLDRLDFPLDKAILAHLSPEDFKCWIYRRNPREALLIACSREFDAMAQAQRRKGKLRRIMDFIWRLTHGVPFQIA